MRLGTRIGVGLLVVAGLGCGGGGSQPAGGSYNAISANIAHPTGMLSATNADAVAQAYEASLSSGLNSGSASSAGQRLQSVAAATTTISEACPNGGTISVNATEASSTAVNETFTYNSCCESAGCCYNGGGNLYYASTSSSSGAFCESFQVTGTCSGTSINENFSLCDDTSSGTISYLVEVDGETFAVSGSYSAGSGTLTITGANGTYTCTYTSTTGTYGSATGSCTGTGGSFTF